MSTLVDFVGIEDPWPSHICIPLRWASCLQDQIGRMIVRRVSNCGETGNAVGQYGVNQVGNLTDSTK